MSSIFFKVPVESSNVIQLGKLENLSSATFDGFTQLQTMIDILRMQVEMAELNSAVIFRKDLAGITNQNTAGLFGASKPSEPTTTQNSTNNVIKFK